LDTAVKEIGKSVTGVEGDASNLATSIAEFERELIRGEGEVRIGCGEGERCEARAATS
jgi:hypothetical protein